MKDRIKHIMENEHLTPAKFADRLQINRAVVSHILNGRNNPSLDVVTKILTEMDYINPEWLLTGIGQMYKEDADMDMTSQEPDLFRQNDAKGHSSTERKEHSKETDVNPVKKSDQFADNKMIDSIKIVDKKIAQIIIYYNDNTFETFIPHPAK